MQYRNTNESSICLHLDDIDILYDSFINEFADFDKVLKEIGASQNNIKKQLKTNCSVNS